MELFAIATGWPGDEDVLCCCAIFPILPLVVLLAGLAVFRNSFWAACVAFLLASLPCAMLVRMVAGYQPSTDGDVAADQATGWRAVELYAVLAAVAGLSLLWVVGRRLVQGRAGNPRSAEPSAAADGGA